MRWTLLARKMMRADAYGQAVWSCPLDAGVKRMEKRFRPCGRNAEIHSRRRLTRRTLRGMHGAAVKPLRRECRSDFGVPVMALRASFLFCARGNGCGVH